MTTNSPNPVDGDVQALIEYCQRVLHGSNNGSQMELVYKIALAALTAEPEYNVSFEGGEIRLDVTKAEYNGRHPDYRWISYTIPPAQLLRPVELPFKRDLRDEQENGFLERAIGWNECIDEVQRLNTTAQPVSDGWVKCSDRMPELGKPVLVVGVVGNTVQNNVYEWDGMTWCDYRNDYGDVKKDAFTHWMPLPAAPGCQDS